MKKKKLDLSLEEVAKQIRPEATDDTRTASPSSVATHVPCECCCS